jgi:putative nucleotidyltransferase with HDIG domain
MIKSNPISQKIKHITESIISLPTLPTVVSKMIELVDNPKTSAASLARLISTDQALTARILKLANSAYYGFPREISTVNMAIIVLGFNTVKEMGLSLSVFEIFKGTSEHAAFDTGRFWQHSIGCGSATRMLARRLKYRSAGEAFVAGLLHDIGKVVLSQYMRDEFIAVVELEAQGAKTLDEAENDVFGVSHAEVGMWLAEKWNLPRIIAESIGFHHAPWEGKLDPVLTAIVSVSNHLCHLSKIGDSGRKNPVKPDEKTWDIFRKAAIPLDEPDLAELQSEVFLEFDKTDSMMTALSE